MLIIIFLIDVNFRTKRRSWRRSSVKQWSPMRASTTKSHSSYIRYVEVTLVILPPYCKVMFNKQDNYVAGWAFERPAGRVWGATVSRNQRVARKEQRVPITQEESRRNAKGSSTVASKRFGCGGGGHELIDPIDVFSGSVGRADPALVWTGHGSCGQRRRGGNVRGAGQGKCKWILWPWAQARWRSGKQHICTDNTLWYVPCFWPFEDHKHLATIRSKVCQSIKEEKSCLFNDWFDRLENQCVLEKKFSFWSTKSMLAS